MGRYIDADKAVEAIRKYADIKHNNGEQIEYINGILKSISVIIEQPTADVVEVVHCGECKFADNSCAYGLVCICEQGGMQSTIVSKRDYCSHGKRRTE